jgi:hypothetical protein
MSLTEISTVAGLLVTLVGVLGLAWKSGGQWRGISARLDELSKDATGLQSQKDCIICRSQVDAKLSTVYRKQALAEQEVHSIKEMLLELKQMLAQIQSDVSVLAIETHTRRPAPRQNTQPRIVMPLPPPEEDES